MAAMSFKQPAFSIGQPLIFTWVSDLNVEVALERHGPTDLHVKFIRFSDALHLKRVPAVVLVACT